MLEIIKMPFLILISLLSKGISQVSDHLFYEMQGWTKIFFVILFFCIVFAVIGFAFKHAFKIGILVFLGVPLLIFFGKFVMIVILCWFVYSIIQRTIRNSSKFRVGARNK